MLASPHLQELVTIEIEPQMIAGSRYFSIRPTSARSTIARSSMVIDDAKSYFASAHRRFDLIMSAPSNPWVSGVSGLFTDEFYTRVRRYLTDDGVFSQWLQIYELDDSLVLSVLAAIHRNFPVLSAVSDSERGLTDRREQSRDVATAGLVGRRASCAPEGPLQFRPAHARDL